MNFGDILDKWEKQNNSSLYAHGIYDKDAGTGESAPGGVNSRRRLRAKKADASLDIHGFRREEAWTALERFFENARTRGYVKLLVIHGKGNHSKGEAVLGRTVREFIEHCPFAGESGHEKAAGGGSGATWVLLKLSPSSASRPPYPGA